MPLLGSFSVKKPSPLIARSRFEPVVLMLPCVNCWAVEESRTPSPIAEVFKFTAPAANTSANSARDCLNPTVFALATLLAVTSRSELAAVNPDNAMLNAAMCVLLKELVGNLLDAAERHAANPRHVQRQSRRSGAHADALDRAVDQGGRRRAAGSGAGILRAQGVLARGGL